MKTVLFFCDARSEPASRKFAGICSVGRRKRWNVKFICPRNIPISDYLSIWHPCGIITDNHRYASRRIPTVYLDADINENGLRRIVHDPAAAAQIAFDEFVRLQITNLAFLPPLVEHTWSDERKRAFVNVARTAQLDVSIFRKRRTAADTPTLQKRLIAWLRGLRRPCGIFAANDNTAELLLNTCPQAGIRVPEDAAVIGVDNISLLCENTFPSLTSIAPAFDESGRIAAEALDELMSGGTNTSLTTFGEQGIVRRESTKRLYGRETDIRKARDLINREACSGLKARDVLKLMRGSRRGAEIRFKAETGCTIQEAIVDVRLKRALSLLKNTSLSLSEISTECGYASSSHLRKVFELKVRQTMGVWRKANKLRQ